MKDKYEGQGGRYVLNIQTGERKLVQRTEAAGSVPQLEPAPPVEVIDSTAPANDVPKQSKAAQPDKPA